MSAAAVEVADLIHAYGSRRALDGVSLTVEPGRLFGLLGPNGGGKSTLFRILATLITPTGGSAKILSLDVVREAPTVRRRIGVVFQSPSLDPMLTVAENLLHQGHLYGLRGRDLRRRRDEVLEQFNVADRATDRVATLSGGLARRVELAKGLMHRPEVLLLDEPSTGLDPGARRDLAHHLRALCADHGVTVLLTTHIIAEAEMCDRLAILDAGRIVARGAVDELKDQIGGDCVTITAADPASLSAQIAERFNCEPVVVDGQVRIERDRGYELIAQLMEAFGPRIDSVTVSKPTLEDVFIRCTGHRLEQDEPVNQDA